VRDRCDTLVVGGGLTGCAAAYYLARAGVDVVLVDRADLNTEASGRNAGGFHVQIQLEPFQELGEDWAVAWTPTIELLVDAVELWGTLSAELGVDLEVKVSGGLLVADSGEQLAKLERKAAIERDAGLAVEILDGTELRRHAPYLSEHLLGGLLCPVEGKANPLLATPAFARAATARGARVETGIDVLAVERTAAGYRVGTSGGSVECERIVDAAGVDAGRLAALVGVDLPVESYPMQVQVTEAVAPLVRHLVAYAGEPLTVKQAAVGSILIGGGWPARSDEASGRLAVNAESLRANLRVAQRVVPALAQARLLRTWAGSCNGTPDHRPLIGELEGAPGFFVAVFPYVGFTGAPLLGRIVADLARGASAGYDLTPFAPSRFVAA
jgi:sarcosine oxidase subunit beta